METYEAIKSRRSVRNYMNKEVKEEDIKKIVDAGRLSATANNIQPWEFVVVRDRKNREKLAEIASKNGPYMKESPVVIAVFCKDTKYWIEDGSAATQNMLVMARDLGLGSCWIAGAKKDYSKKVCEFLGVPEGYNLLSLICIGYPEKGFPEIQKRSLNEVLHWEKF